MRKSSKTRSDNTASSSIAAERLADYRGDSGSATASGSSIAFGPASPNVSPSTPDTENTSGTSPAISANACSTVLGRMNLSEELYSGDTTTHLTSEVEQSTATTKEAGK